MTSNSQPLKAITIRQPFAFLAAHGIKPVENRNGPSIAGQARKLVGKRLAVHVSEWWNLKAFREAGYELPQSGRSALADTAVAVRPFDLICSMLKTQRGHIIGTAILGRVIEHGDGDPMNLDPCRTADRFGLVFREQRLVTPVKCRGALGLWTVPDDVARAVI